jgi:hypothetical protein
MHHLIDFVRTYSQAGILIGAGSVFFTLGVVLRRQLPAATDANRSQDSLATGVTVSARKISSSKP